MAVFTIWITVETDVVHFPPSDRQLTYTYDTSTDLITNTITWIPIGSGSDYNPIAGTEFYSVCTGTTQYKYTGTGNEVAVNKIITPDYVPCCAITLDGFSVNKTNNTSSTPNGTISITRTSDIGLYEASIDGGTNYFTEIDDVIKFEGLSSGTYDILIREIGTVCKVSAQAIIIDNISVVPPIVDPPIVFPSGTVYDPIFYPIEFTFNLANNEVLVSSDGSGTYLYTTNPDAVDFLESLPIVKIIDNPSYNGTYQITGVDSDTDPTRFYFDKAYSSDQTVKFVPFGRQSFQLFAETEINVFNKIADIEVSCNLIGKYVVRLEGFLQSVFSVKPPVNNGVELTLLRKYYVLPVDFESIETAPIRNAVYSATPDLSYYLNDLVPLGPVPINFINRETLRGFPVLFSYIDTALGRVVNITSSYETDIITTQSLIYIPALPLNEYSVTYIATHSISGLSVTPALPEWIEVLASSSDRVVLKIRTFTDEGGDYEPDDYNEDDYITNGLNAIVGCYTFDFTDSMGDLFTLNICVYPVQNVNDSCVSSRNDVYNIAWVNVQGGWSSYVFNGSNSIGKSIGTIKDYKRNFELRKASVEEVYDTVEIKYANLGRRDLDFIANLRQSVQAYLYNYDTQQWDIPIYLDKSNFEIRKTPFRQAEQSDGFTFRYSKNIIIQRQ